MHFIALSLIASIGAVLAAPHNAVARRNIGALKGLNLGANLNLGLDRFRQNNNNNLAVVVFEDQGFYGDNRFLGNFGRQNQLEQLLLFDDRFRQSKLNLFDNGFNRNVNRNIFDFDLDLGFNNQFLNLDELQRQIFLQRQLQVNLIRLQDIQFQQRQFNFFNNRRQDFFNNNFNGVNFGNDDLVVVLAQVIQNSFNGVLERPYFDYVFSLFHQPGSQSTRTLVFTDSVTLTVAQTIGPNGETGTVPQTFATTTEDSTFEIPVSTESAVEPTATE